MSLFSFFSFDDKTDMKIKIAANLSFLACFGAAGWIASLMNFSAEHLGMNALDFGLVLTINETAVIFGFVISFLLSYISESRLLGILIAMAGMGILICAFAGFENPIFAVLYSFTGTGINRFAVNLAIFSFILSLSIEYFEKTRDSLVKHSTDNTVTSLIMSKISAYCLLGTAAGYLVVTIVGFIPMNITLENSETINISHYVLYPLLGLPLIVIGIMSSKKAASAKALRENIEIIIRGKFFNFYMLTFCTAAVNIIMIYFGTFFLVDKFGLSLGFIGLIFLLHSGLVFFLKGKASEIMKSKGEDFTLKIRYIVTLVFFAVLLICSSEFVGQDSFMKYVLFIILALYGLTTLFDNSIKSFISYFASPNEQRSNLMVYIRLIQIAKIIIPLTAGFLCVSLYSYGYYGVFGLGLLLAGICLFISYKIYSAYQGTEDGKPLEEG